MEAIMQEDNLSLAKRVRAMFRQLEKVRDPYMSDYEQIAQYVMYRREFFDLDQEQGKSISRTKYDSTAGEAAMNLAHGFQGYMVSRSIKWLDLEFENKELENYKEAAIWLESIVQHLYEVFKSTNFYDCTNDNLMDAVGFGTPCLYSENDEDKDRIVYSERHPIEIYITENRYGIVDTVFREYKMSAREIVKQFPRENISDKILKEAERSESLYNQHIIIHACFPNEDAKEGSKQSKDKKFKSVYIEKNAQYEDKTLSEKGYDGNPYIVWRWDKNSTEWYGRSPSHIALPEILASNQLEKAILEAVEKTVNPPMSVPSRQKGSIKLFPGGINYYERLDQEKMEPIVQGIQLPIGLEEREDMRNRIKSLYFNDFFLILSQYMTGVKTATEVMEVQGEKAAIIGPIIGRYETRFLDPIIDRTYKLEEEAGRLPEMPPILEDYTEQAKENGNKRNIKIKYIGPLATIQEKLYKTTGVQHTLGAVAPIAELQLSSAPVLDNFNWDEMAKDTAKVQGASPTHFRDNREVKQIREARAEAQAQAQQLEIAERAAKVAPGLGKKVEKGSVMDEMRKE